MEGMMNRSGAREGREEQGQSRDCDPLEASNWQRLPEYRGQTSAYLEVERSIEETLFGRKPRILNVAWRGEGRVIELSLQCLVRDFPGIDFSRPFVLGSLALTPIGRGWDAPGPMVYAVRREDIVGRWLMPAWGWLWRLRRKAGLRLWLTACVWGLAEYDPERFARW
jgi:hypothetical protein